MWWEQGQHETPGLLGARGQGGEEADATTSLSSDAFDFNYGVCVMRMREGLNISKVMQAHSEFTPHLLETPCQKQNRIPSSCGGAAETNQTSIHEDVG